MTRFQRVKQIGCCLIGMLVLASFLFWLVWIGIHSNPCPGDEPYGPDGKHCCSAYYPCPQK